MFCSDRWNKNTVEMIVCAEHSCPAEDDFFWTYNGKANGKQKWTSLYQTCYRGNQSPIAIRTSRIETNVVMKRIKYTNYNFPLTKATIENTGYTVQITPRDKVDRWIQVKGTLYFLELVHFHWGSKKTAGSEHVIDGKRYDMEAQFLHRDDRGEIAIVSVLFERTQSVYNEGFHALYEILSQIHFRDYKTQLRSDLNLEVLIPHESTSFYHYEGSLTIPGCDAGVQWFILKNINYIQSRHDKYNRSTNFSGYTL
ncbi:carbonic anhydrase [Trichonephila clavata]|uniref:carbonic anhydrase n=1 Tax=Trichonephila clavata TaxID=2740835 RepID=A0A8X6FNB3_TRICU|nr:carbonic anhydrase [Trichonephila clavata]